MRRLAAVVLGVSIVLSGCLGDGDDDGGSSRGGPDADAGTGAAANATAPTGGAARLAGLLPPVLRHGTAFTFAASGVYDHVPEFTVVVVNQTDGTQLLAMSRPEELVDVIIWWNGFNGVLDGQLNPVYPGQDEPNPHFRFPLSDGKTWPWGEQAVTVRARDVSTPIGTRAGFEMRTERENGYRAWEYVPEIGFITSLHGELDGVVYRDLRLQRIGTASSWVWYEQGPRHERTGDTAPLEPYVFEVADGFDAVAVSAGFLGEGRVAVLAPPAPGAPSAPWTAESADPSREQWTGTLLPPTAGPWAVTVQDPPSGGFAWAVAVPVRWIGP